MSDTKREPSDPVAWQYRYIDPDEGPSSWVDCPRSDVDIYRASKRYEVRGLVPADTIARLEQELEDERTPSWWKLMAHLDKVYPEWLIPVGPDRPDRDPGPRIVTLIRLLDAERKRAEAAEKIATAADTAKSIDFYQGGAIRDAAGNVIDGYDPRAVVRSFSGATYHGPSVREALLEFYAAEHVPDPDDAPHA